MSETYPTTPGVRFKLVEGFPAYCVGTDGSVWSRWTPGPRPILSSAWHELKGCTRPSGHHVIGLGKGHYRYVHRLVLEAFVGPCPDGHQCCHRNDDAADNRLENLYWGTPRQNSHDAIRNGSTRLGERALRAKLTGPEVLEIVARYRAGQPTREIAARFRTCVTNIQSIVYGRSWGHLTGIPRYVPKARQGADCMVR